MGTKLPAHRPLEDTCHLREGWAGDIRDQPRAPPSAWPQQVPRTIETATQAWENWHPPSTSWWSQATLEFQPVGTACWLSWGAALICLARECAIQGNTCGWLHPSRVSTRSKSSCLISKAFPRPRRFSWCWKTIGFGVCMTNLSQEAWLSAHLMT